ncbi:VOC family protein [Wenyingzhuangia sp. 2_MG-2023]|uniref:SMU1112c/YaeR family gloxylase I-like metalloprotein n=1 Tax=Wenyingzhuangia sp. 2_MG-2023 TaxID=3062639 RepID=UPI0026E2799D|nr:VOC family protein [Wenyingzhuangia sp. 2_MG-2023]MDO6737298.1 VOC family protein [Wenyingzhuangia sp. 2_MG-2023]
MLKLNKLHHVAIICKNYQLSKEFYTNVLGFTILQEIYRKERDSYKLDLCLNGTYIIELFSFPNPPQRPSRPEALGLRHLAFEVDDIEENVKILQDKNVNVEPIRMDPHTGKKFTFFADPDNLPLEIYEN